MAVIGSIPKCAERQHQSRWRQQVFSFSEDGGRLFETYVANVDAVHALQLAIEGKWHGCLYLWGAPASGKSHLLEAACLRAGQQGIKTAWQQLQVYGGSVTLAEIATTHSFVCIDDLQYISKLAQQELDLLACYEQLQARRGVLLLAADVPPSELPLQLDDVRSRLAASLSLRLRPLDDAGRLQAMRLRLQQQSMQVADDLLQILLQRVPRDMHTLFRALDGMVDIARAQRRRITPQFIHRNLQQFVRPIA